MYNKTIIWFDFCDFQSNRGLGKGYQPKPNLDLDYSGSQKPHPIIVYYLTEDINHR